LFVFLGEKLMIINSYLKQS